MSRLQNAFENLKAANRKALIPYICAGDPKPELTVPLMHALVGAGATAIEVGMPFSDPMADGITIQMASERAIAQGVGLKNVIAMVELFRKDNQSTPVVLMGYANPIEHLGIDLFVSECARVGVDGVLVVDYPPQESTELWSKLKACNIDTIYLLAPTSTEQRIEEVAERASGYVYYVSIKGVTGSAEIDINAVAEKLPSIRAKTTLPICVGFGIRDAESAKQVAQVAEGVIIGSQLIKELQTAGENAVNHGAQWIGDIRRALDQIR